MLVIPQTEKDLDRIHFSELFNLSVGQIKRIVKSVGDGLYIKRLYTTKPNQWIDNADMRYTFNNITSSRAGVTFVFSLITKDYCYPISIPAENFLKMKEYKYHIPIDGKMINIPIQQKGMILKMTLKEFLKRKKQ